MATGTLTGQAISNTYKSLLKITGTTAGGETLGTETVIVIEDGHGNPSALSLSQQRATITLGSGAADDFIVDGTTYNALLALDETALAADPAGTSDGKYYIIIPPGGSVALRGDGTNVEPDEVFLKCGSGETTTIEFIIAIE